MKTRTFRDLLVWQRAMELARNVYLETNDFPKTETFGLTSQMRRASVSIPSNVAEGQGRLTDKGFAVFLAQARGSLFELETQIELATSLSYLNAEASSSLLRDCSETGFVERAAQNVEGGGKVSRTLRIKTANRSSSGRLLADCCP